MKKSAIFACLLLPLSALAAPDLKEWQTRYDAVTKAVTMLNPSRYWAFCSKDFVWVQADGKKMTKQQAAATFMPMFKSQKITGSEKVVKLTQRGDFVDVNYETNLVITPWGKKAEHYHEIGVDTWKQFNGKWLVVKSVTLPEPKKK